MEYSAPVTYDDVPLDDIRSIEGIYWFSRQAVSADASNAFVSLERYGWDGETFWGVSVEALGSRVWQDAITVDEIDLYFEQSTITAKRARHARDVYKGLVSLLRATSVEAGLYVDLWRYRTYGERSLVENLCALPVACLEAWSGRFKIDAAAICWDRAMLRSEFRYEDQSSSVYWNTQLVWERRTL